ncbi:TetR/AcrR family transcriptional regulator [Shewanella youngdeokensis]|uniref:TetR/AcrR family transcriptional regulator n=1 Tax=Shewanella youngdeokensis TaxID=2999068 RepID=A0ABZ0JVX2_9GAMM|nr:TetR/AcrR family transcriptional regulator [Shewanella sp. DAU334]
MHNHLKTESSTRDRILAEAKKLIIAEGLCSFRLSQLPQLSQCSPKTFYNHFKSREDIVAALYIVAINDSMEKQDQLMARKDLSFKEKVVYKHMYDVVKCWSAKESDICVNFLGANPHIYGVSSPEFEGNMDVIFIEIKNKVQELWKQAIKSGELLSSKKEIVDCIFLIRTIERGSIVIGQNKFVRQHGHDNSLETFFDLVCFAANTLKWKDEQQLSFTRMLEVVTPYIESASGSTFKHCKLNYETLNDPLEL